MSSQIRAGSHKEEKGILGGAKEAGLQSGADASPRKLLIGTQALGPDRPSGAASEDLDLGKPLLVVTLHETWTLSHGHIGGTAGWVLSGLLSPSAKHL